MISRKLLDQFIYLIKAVECFDILLKNSKDGPDNFLSEFNEIVTAEKRLNELNVSLVVDEIENNLFLISGSGNQLIFIKSVLRNFSRVFPYYNYQRFYSEPTKKHLFAVDQINRMEAINAAMLRAVDELFSDQNASFFIIESYFIESYLALEAFAREFTAMLLNFGFDLKQLENELGIFISIGERDAEYIESLGFGKTKDVNVILKKVVGNKSATSLDEPPKYVASESMIKNLRLLFDGFLWEKEEIPDKEFVNYWKIGPKSRPLPIKNRKVIPFLYLYFTYLNKLDKFNKWPINHQDTEITFNISNVANRKGNINEESADVKKVNSQMRKYLFHAV